MWKISSVVVVFQEVIYSVLQLVEKRDSTAFAVLNASGCRVREQVCGQLEGRGWTPESCVQVHFPLQSYTVLDTEQLGSYCPVSTFSFFPFPVI